MINPEDVTILLIAHQSGLFNLVKDMPVSQLRNNLFGEHIIPNYQLLIESHKRAQDAVREWEYAQV